MRRRFEDPLLAAGPIAVAAAYALHPLAGVAGLAVLVALALRTALPRPRRDREAAGAPVVAVAELTPRRPRARTQVSVAAVAGFGVRALRPADLHGGRVRRTYLPRRRGDAALRAACLQVATRRNARLTNAAAVQLGLAEGPLGAPAASDPDPLLLAARWPDAA